MQQRDAKADLAKLEGLVGEIDRLRNDVTDILAAGGQSAEILLSQLATLGQTARDYLPHARELATGAEERQQATVDYVRQRYSAPQRRGER